MAEQIAQAIYDRETKAKTEFAAVAVSPALVRPLTNLRREMSCDRYFTTSSLIVVP